ncbi:hypothetical protein [Conexibacter sp. CPCC 206217]|uniref:hypothetical protein n=1 Tax=Conexibacter sp. CPCC 206217 TaxID=3064574 RepID=UPI00271853D3|nr:hypothetical protein [Conexibacter sp. CPCC 206217]MDO8209890.1 hypothetical protein [Conexibacter sp. CPCC 206217]
MKLGRGIGVLAVAASFSCAFAFASSAGAAFPNFSDCPRSAPDIQACFDAQSTTGSLTIKGFTVPLGTSFEIRGGLVLDATSPTGNRFVPPVGKTGVFAKPVEVPGGLLGIDFPIPGNKVTATAQLAGSPSSILVDPGTLTVRVPLKLALTNPIIGPGCQIGSNSSPVTLTLIVGTTRPPLPNRPISGRPGTFDFSNPSYVAVLDNTSVDNSFSVPGASGCGIGLGLINALVNAKLRLPSAGGNNTIIVTNNIGIGGLTN